MFNRIIFKKTSCVVCSGARLLQVVTWTDIHSGLVTLTLTFWPRNWCGMSAMTRTTFAPVSVFLRLFVVELQAKTLSNWRHDIITFTFEVTAYVGDAGHRALSAYFPFWRYGWFLVPALSGLVTLTFDLSTSKCGHGSPTSWASFLPIFSFLRSSILDLGSGMGQTDRQTTAFNA